MRRFVIPLVSGVAVVVILFAGCVPGAPPTALPPVAPPTAPPPAEEEVKYLNWGCCSCLSGPFAPWGLSEDRSYRMEVDDINEAGGCWGDIWGHEPGFRVEGQLYKIKRYSYDYKLDPMESVKVVNRLIYEDKCTFIHIFIVAGLYPNRKTLTENGCFVTLQGAGDEMIGPEYPRSFRNMMMPEVAAMAIIPYFYNEEGIREVACISENTEMHMSLMRPNLAELRKLGVEPVSELYFEPGTTDFVPILTKVIPKEPELLIFEGSCEIMGLLAKQARELGYTGQIYFPAPWTWKELVECSGSEEVMEGLMCTMMIAECTLPRQIWYRDEYIRRYGEAEWCTSIVDRADILYRIIESIEYADSLDPDEVARAMETQGPERIKSFYGDPAWAGGATVWGVNHDLVMPVPLVTIHNGKQVEKVKIVIPRDAY